MYYGKGGLGDVGNILPDVFPCRRFGAVYEENPLHL
jgi:hypothetical protein